METIGLIAGATQFPLLIACEARARGYHLIAVGIREEVQPELAEAVDEFHLISLGELSKLIKIFKKAGVKRAIMAGKVQHRSIFGSIKPDFKLLSVLMKLRKKNTDSIIGAVVAVLEEEGITIMDSTAFLQNLLAPEGLLTKSKPTKDEQKSVEYGVKIARELTRLDIGQTVVVKDGACVALEAMEGTDETIRRAYGLCGDGAVVVKLSKPSQDFRFDVPVCGMDTVKVMASVKARVLAVEAGRTLLFDKDHVIQLANRLDIVLLGIKAE